MNSAMNYKDLFILINCMLFIVNLILLIFSFIRYTRSQRSRRSAEVCCIENKRDGSVDVKDGLLVNEPIKSDQKTAEVLISKVTEDRLIEQFKKVQASRFFLKRGVSMQDLAHLLGTNQRYVSYILNRYVGLDFNSYIQQARIEYLINCVEKDPDLLNVKFSVLAEKAGFPSMSKFSSVFKSVKGIPPSEYFQRMRMTL